MSRMTQPVVGSWYRHRPRNEVVRVLEVRDDGDRGHVEVQHEDGHVTHMAVGPWLAMDLEPADEPPGWPGPERVRPADLKHTVQSFPPNPAPQHPTPRFAPEGVDWANESVEQDDERPGQRPS